MMRAFNAREGMDQDDDVLPKKLFKPLEGGPTERVAIPQDQFIKARVAYYDMAGWEKTKGTPTRKKLEELGLDWILD